MFQGERKATPLSDLDGRTVTSEHKSQTVSVFHLNLPDYVPADKIGLNLPRLHRDLRTGGIGQVIFRGTSGETTSFTPEIVGRGRDGSAAAGLKATEKRAPTYRTNIGGINNPNLFGFNQVRWANVSVSLNLSEIQKKLSEKHELRSAKAWSKELNSAMRNGVVSEGIRHLVGDQDIIDLWFFSGGFSPHIFASGDGVVANIFEAFGGYGLLNISQRLMVQNLRNSGRLDNNLGFRWSFFRGPQLDRAAILYARSKTSSLVKPIGKKE